MRMVADTNAFLAVVLNEPERDWLIAATTGHDLISPAHLPYELGNALTALLRRKALAATQLAAVWDAVAAIPVALATIDVRAAVVLAGSHGLYAYDAYFLQCAIEARAPLLTLDKGMKRAARELKIPIVE